MKKANKLVLGRETIGTLSQLDLAKIHGGEVGKYGSSPFTSCPLADIAPASPIKHPDR